MNAADLLADQQCTAGCLLSTSTRRRCRCVCGGTLHAALSGADVSAIVDVRRWGQLHRLTDLEVISA